MLATCRWEMCRVRKILSKAEKTVEQRFSNLAIIHAMSGRGWRIEGRGKSEGAEWKRSRDL